MNPDRNPTLPIGESELDFFIRRKLNFKKFKYYEKF